MGLLQSKEEKAAAEAKRIAEKDAHLARQMNRQDELREKDRKKREESERRRVAMNDGIKLASQVFRGWTQPENRPSYKKFHKQEAILRVRSCGAGYDGGRARDNIELYPAHLEIMIGLVAVDAKAGVYRKAVATPWLRRDKWDLFRDERDAIEKNLRDDEPNPKYQSVYYFEDVRSWRVSQKTIQIEGSLSLAIEQYFSKEELLALPYVTSEDCEYTQNDLLMKKLQEVSLGLKHIVAANDKKELAAELEGILAALPKVS